MALANHSEHPQIFGIRLENEVAIKWMRRLRRLAHIIRRITLLKLLFWAGYALIVAKESLFPRLGHKRR